MYMALLEQNFFYLVLHNETLNKSLGNTSISGTFFLYSPICDCHLSIFGKYDDIDFSRNKSIMDCDQVNIWIYLQSLDPTDSIVVCFSTIIYDL